MKDDTKVVKKSVYFPVEVAEFIEALSQEENRSFTKQAVHVMELCLNVIYPGWNDERK